MLILNIMGNKECSKPPINWDLHHPEGSHRLQRRGIPFFWLCKGCRKNQGPWWTLTNWAVFKILSHSIESWLVLRDSSIGLWNIWNNSQYMKGNIIPYNHQPTEVLNTAHVFPIFRHQKPSQAISPISYGILVKGVPAGSYLAAMGELWVRIGSRKW